MPAIERLSGWARTLEAALMLALARVLVAMVPLRLWRSTLGRTGGPSTAPQLARATRLARHVGRAVRRLPFEAKCLPQAMALSWMLRRRRLAHSVVIGVKVPAGAPEQDGLHAWLEIDGRDLFGAQPGDWHEVLRLGGR